MSGKASVLLLGYTYSYIEKPPRQGQKGPCCRPTKQKCRQGDKLRSICKKRVGRTKCGEGCTRIIAYLEKLQERQEGKKKQRLRNKIYRSSNIAGPPKREKKEESESFEEYGSSEEYSDEYEDQDTAKKNAPSEQGEMGMRVKKGQKLTSKQLKMIESATKKREKSTNPLCKEKPRSMFRLFVHHTTRQKYNGLRHWVLLKLTEYAKIFSQLSRMRLKLIQN